MPIVHFGNSETTVGRTQVLSFLKQQKEKNPNFKVIDVGGGSNPWAKEYTDAYVDINAFPTDKRLFVGNICEPKIWEDIQESCERFDFSICTHVLEDIRDPLFVARGLMKISKAGFISMPNKHTELSNVESRLFLGYCHHRWIFTIQEAEIISKPDEDAPLSDAQHKNACLVAIAKLPIVQYWNISLNPLVRVIHLASRNTMMAKVLRRLRLNPAVPRPTWINPELGHGNMELGFRWEEGFEFKILNGDYAGHSSIELARLYIESLGPGV